MFAKIRVTHFSLRSAGGMDKKLVSAGDSVLVRVMVVFTAYSDIFLSARTSALAKCFGLKKLACATRAARLRLPP
jgi:hypothetical protein